MLHFKNVFDAIRPRRFSLQKQGAGASPAGEALPVVAVMGYFQALAGAAENDDMAGWRTARAHRVIADAARFARSKPGQFPAW